MHLRPSHPTFGERIRRCSHMIAAACVASMISAHADEGKVIYHWDATAFHPAEGNPWKAELVTRPGGKPAGKITGTSAGFNNYLAIPKGKLKAGQDYTAIIEYEIATPAKFPDSFHLFTRSSKLGQERDIWRLWNGDAGDKGTVKLTLSIKGNQESDDWVFMAGSKGPATMIVNRFEVVEGDGLDYIPAEPGPLPAAPADGGDLPKGAGASIIDPPAKKQGLQLSAKDFGLTADGPDGPVPVETAAANFEAMVAALKACRMRNASTLVVPRGVYRFHSDAPIPILDLSDLVIDGQGSEFIFTKLRTGVEAVSVQRCQRMVIKDLKLDWDWNVMPIASLAKVLAVSPDGKSYDMAFPDLGEKEIALIKTAPWTHLIPMDPVTLTRGLERYPVSLSSIENLTPTTLRVTTKTAVPLQVGRHYCARHLYYNFEGFKVGFSNHLIFDRVTIHSMPGMGWLFTGDMHHWKLRDCRVARRGGSRHPFTTAADGFHIAQSQGDLTIENCEFTGSGDDSINIHDACFQGVQRVNDTTLSLINCPPYRLRIQKDDKVELFKGDYTPLGYTSKVNGVTYKDQNTTLNLSDPLPPGLSPLSIVLNRRYDTHNVRISSCRFHDTNGRSILISARDATIENCTFKNAIGTAVQFHTEIVGALWAEGSGASNIVVRGNTFEGTSYEGRYDNAVVYAGAKLPTGITRYPLFHDLLIERNQFLNCSGPAVSLFSSARVIVRDNVIGTNLPRPEANTLSGSLHAAYSENVAFSRNVWKTSPEPGRAGVLVDRSNSSRVVAEGNVILK